METEAPWRAALRNVRTWRRSPNDRVFGGVCGGLGRIFGIDPVLLRIGFVMLTLTTGVGCLLYLIAWVGMPLDGSTSPRTSRHLLPTLCLIAAGLVLAFVVLAVNGIAMVPAPILFIAACSFFWHRRRVCRTRATHHSSYVRPAPASDAVTPDTVTTGSDVPASGIPTSATPLTATPRTWSTVHNSAQNSAQTNVDWTADDPLGLYSNAADVHVRPRASSWRLKLSIATLSLGAIAIAAVVLGPAAACIAGLVVLGLGMVAGSFAGRTAGLFWLGMPLAIVMVAVGLFGTVAPDRQFGDTTTKLTTIGGRSVALRHSVGDYTLDLSALERPGSAATIDVRNRIGTLTVVLPSDPAITVLGRACVRVGTINTGTRSDSGPSRRCIDLGGLVPQTGRSTASVRLNLSVDVGDIEVVR